MKTQTWDSSGYKDKQDDIREIKIDPPLDVVKNMYPDRDYTVVLNMNEFTSVCPKTGLPDYADITIRYTPGAFLVEEKALKLYLTSYRSLGIFQEHATNKILDDFVAVVQPRKVRITALWNARGGIGVEVVAQYKEKSKKKA